MIRNRQSFKHTANAGVIRRWRWGCAIYFRVIYFWIVNRDGFRITQRRVSIGGSGEINSGTADGNRRICEDLWIIIADHTGDSFYIPDSRIRYFCHFCGNISIVVIRKGDFGILDGDIRANQVIADLDIPFQDQLGLRMGRSISTTEQAINPPEI